MHRGLKQPEASLCHLNLSDVKVYIELICLQNLQLHTPIAPADVADKVA